jgi:carbon storage regulator
LWQSPSFRLKQPDIRSVQYKPRLAKPLEFIHGGLKMLVLSRKERERIRLGDSIVLTIVRVSGDRVRLGIEAPADMLVLREELDSAVEVEVVVQAKAA